jgi:hypothetical protein
MVWDLMRGIDLLGARSRRWTPDALWSSVTRWRHRGHALAAIDRRVMAILAYLRPRPDSEVCAGMYQRSLSA